MGMKIATWNVERLRHRKALNEISACCERVAADILVLTETDERIKLPYRNCVHTARAIEEDPTLYSPSENRVAIYTDFDIIRQHPTFNGHTAICAVLDTPVGPLAVYGTIIGVYGNRHKSFLPDLRAQVVDFSRLSRQAPLCICGDFNCSFADNFCFTHSGRDDLLRSFSDNRISLLTKNVPECIDHIALSTSLVGDEGVAIEEWNMDFKLSDHKGIAVTI